MKRVYVKSSSIRTVGYDPRTQTLEIEFVGHSVYRYLRVPKEIYQALMAAESKGAFVNQIIKPYFECIEGESRRAG